MGVRVHRRDVSFFDGSGLASSLAAGRRSGPLFGKGLVYSTFLGGSQDDRVSGHAKGADGSGYVTGDTYSPDFPTTIGAFDTSFNGGRDVFVSRLDPSGSVLDYSTFLGGTEWDIGSSLEVGADGSVYVGGTTYSDDFPTTPTAFDPVFNGGTTDGFLFELNPDGSGLVFSTFLGGSDSAEFLYGLALSGDGTLFATGETCSADFPTTPGAFDTSFDACKETFVTALNSSGSALVYSTFLGGTRGAEGYGIALGPDGTAYVTGLTLSNDFPTTAGAFDTTSNGSNDSYVSHFNSDGSALIYSTYVGGGDDDYGQGIVVDQDGDAFLTGWTSSADFPTTPGAYDPTINSFILTDAFATKLDPSGSALVYSTFLGGKSSDLGTAISVEPDGSLDVIGWTGSSNFPTTAQAYQPVLRGAEDAFVARFDPTGGNLPYSTFLGGGNTDQGYAIAPAGAGAISVAGITFSRDFPTTPGAYDNTWNGRFDVFLATLQVARTFHVDSIDPTYRQSGSGFDVGARVTIVFADRHPVAGALITVELDYPDASKAKLTGRTGPSGAAVVKHFVTETGTYTFTVLSIVRSPFVYDPAQNAETSDSITIP